jgi:hypothetical protein
MNRAVKFLFLDDRPYEYVRGFQRRLGQPEKHPDNPVLRPELPHEFKRVHYYGTARFDGRDGLFKTWYSTHYYAPGIHESDKGKAFSYLCYASSRDGIRWEKPALDVKAGTNVVMDNEAGVHGPSVLIDDADPDPAARFKLAMAPYRNGNGVTLYVSPDGIHWKPFHDGKPVIEVHSDCHIGFYRDPATLLYRTSFRTRVPDRRVWASESGDLVHWSRPVMVLEPDQGDPCGTQMYGMQMTPYGSFVLGWISMYDTSDFTVDASYKKMAGTMDVQLAYSRDGFCWHRACQGEKFIPFGGPGEWDAGCLMPSSTAICRPDGILFYYSAAPYGHSGPLTIPYESIAPECIGLASLRPDGFVELAAGEETAELMSRPFMVTRGRLFLNAAASGGCVAAEISDTAGAAIPGFSFDDCIPFRGDSRSHEVAWKGTPDACRIERTVIRLKLRARRARLFSALFQNDGDPADYGSFKEIGCLNPAWDVED